MTTEPSPTGTPGFPLGGIRVLFVDESPDERALFDARFGRDFTKLTSVASTDEALVYLERGDVDLLVTEIRLADHDGLELVERMHALPLAQAGAVPAIAATAWVGRAGRGTEVPSGLVGYVVKPYDEEELLAVVAVAAASIAALRSLRAGASVEPIESEATGRPDGGTA